jgi:hypothetical protein
LQASSRKESERREGRGERVEGRAGGGERKGEREKKRR